MVKDYTYKQPESVPVKLPMMTYALLGFGVLLVIFAVFFFVDKPFLKPTLEFQVHILSAAPYLVADGNHCWMIVELQNTTKMFDFKNDTCPANNDMIGILVHNDNTISVE